MIEQLAKLATHLDSRGLSKEADAVDAIIKKIAKAPSWSVTEIVDIGSGYSQIKFNSPQGAIDEQYIFKTEELSLTPGENVSDETISDLATPIEDEQGDVIEESILMGEGSYQDPSEFFKKHNIKAPLKKSEQAVPDGALLILISSSGGKTSCAYSDAVGKEYWTVESNDPDHDCADGGRIRRKTLRESQWR